MAIIARSGEWGGLCRLHATIDNVYALNASTGAKLWSYATGGGVRFLARRGEWRGLCRLRSTAYVYALNASTGAKLWSYPRNL